MEVSGPFFNNPAAPPGPPSQPFPGLWDYEGGPGLLFVCCIYKNVLYSIFIIFKSKSVQGIDSKIQKWRCIPLGLNQKTSTNREFLCQSEAPIWDENEWRAFRRDCRSSKVAPQKCTNANCLLISTSYTYMARTDLRRVSLLKISLTQSSFLNPCICMMQYQTTPNMKDKTFNTPQFYEVGQMKDQICL